MANIQVMLDATGTVLDVSDKDHEVKTDPYKQTITWVLHGVLKQGNFVGFSWGDYPSPKPFGTHDLGNGKSLSIPDTHTNTKTAGKWRYVLLVKYQGTVYTTMLNSPIKTTDPVIINK